MKHYLVFGGSGFIGQHFVDALASRTNALITIADIKAPIQRHLEQHHYVHCDIRSPLPTDLVDSCPDVIVNFAALAREPGFPEREYFAVNADGSKHIADYCETIGCKTMWFISSMSVYAYGDEAKVETTPTLPVTAYGRSKVEAEKIYNEWVANGSERRLLTVRPAVIFGHGEKGNMTRLARALRRGVFVYPGRKNTIKALGYVKDLVDSLFFMSERLDCSLLYNFSYPSVHTLDETCNTICQIAGYRKPSFVVPSSLMYGASHVAQILSRIGFSNGIHPLRITKLISSTNIVPLALQRQGYPFPTTLYSGLEDWFRSDPSGTFE